MSEAEIIGELGSRTEIYWNLIQWFVSISFAVMVAAYWGANKLSLKIVAAIFGLYILTFITAASSILTQIGYIGDLYEALRLLNESNQLSVVGTGALQRQGNNLGSILQPLWGGVSFVFTIGFVVYCYIYERASK